MKISRLVTPFAAVLAGTVLTQNTASAAEFVPWVSVASLDEDRKSGTPAVGVPQNGAAQNGGANGHGQDEKRDIARYRVLLQTTGPNDKDARENAVTALFSMDNREAHELLKDYVAPADGSDPDPEGVRRLVLTELRRRLANPLEKAFALSPHKDVNRRTYVFGLVRNFDEKRTGAVADEMRELARDALCAMHTKDLEFGFGQLLANEDEATRVQAIRAAGVTRNPSMAQRLAILLDDPDVDVAGATRSAMFDLTYQKFYSSAAFTTWWNSNRHRSYLELAERAARETQRLIEAKVKESDQRHLSTVVQLVELLATSSVEGRWTQIRNQVFSSEPAGMLRACLGRLRKVLADRPVVVGADAKDRLELVAAMQARLAAHASATASGADPEAEDYALLLEVGSYLCAATETAPRAAQEKLLLAGVRHKTKSVRLAALCGLRRFFSVDNRVTVVKAATAAFAAGAHDEIETAVATLDSPDWRAPKASDVDAGAYVHGLRKMLAAQSLPLKLRKDVVKVLCKRDADGNAMPLVRKVLSDEVQKKELTTDVRATILLRLFSLLPANGTELTTAAREYLHLLGRLQEDPVPQIRLHAARLMVVPDKVQKDQQTALGQSLIQVIGARLLTEADDGVFGAQVEALQKLASAEAHVEAVNSRLRSALTALLPKPGAKQRLASLVEGLKSVAIQEGRTTGEWLATCEGLLAAPLADRKSIRSIVDYHVGSDHGRQRLATEEKSLQLSVWKLVIRTAALHPGPVGTAWRDKGDRQEQAEAKMVQLAFAELTKAAEYKKDKALDVAASRLAILRCLAALGVGQDLERQATAWLVPSDPVLKGPDRDAAVVLLAEGKLLNGKLADAWKTAGLQAVVGANLSERLRVTEGIADAMIDKKMGPSAVPLLSDLVKNTPQDTPAFWPRVDRYLRIRHSVDPKAGPALLQELDVWARRSSTLTADQRKVVDALRGLLRGTAGPGR